MKSVIIVVLVAGGFFSSNAQVTDSSNINSDKNKSMVVDSAARVNTNQMANSNVSDNSVTDTAGIMSNSNSERNSNLIMDSVENNLTSNMNSNLSGVDSTFNNSNASTNDNISMMTIGNLMGEGSVAALPVLENLVPDVVVSKAKEKYGSALYDITAIKHAPEQAGYVVRISDNGVFKTETIGEDGNVIQ